MPKRFFGAVVSRLPALAGTVACLAIVAGFVWLATSLPHPSFPLAHRPATVVEGLTIFAVFFVGAQAIERLLEPLALALNINGKSKADVKEAARGLQLVRGEAKAETDTAQAALAMAEAANSSRSGLTTVLMWTVATSVAALVSGSFGLYFLSAVGLPVPKLWMDILGTALIIGGGTKPLHDLISLIEKRKEATAAKIPA